MNTSIGIKSIMHGYEFFDFLLFGSFQTEYIIDLKNRSHPDLMGGTVLYAAGGLRCWIDRIAIFGHTLAKHKPQLARLKDQFQIDFKCVHYHDNLQDDRVFLGYVSAQEVVIENPVAFYADKKLPFPKSLIGYSKKINQDIFSGKSKFLPEDIPPHYRDTTMALICPFDIITQLQLSSMLLSASAKTLLIQSSPQYMKMENYDTLPALMKDLCIFVTTTNQIKNLFRNRMSDIWEMAEYLCNLGCEYLIMADDNFNFFLYDHSTKQRFQTPTYPVSLVDPTGMIESFCGGFLAGMKKSFDPLEALIHGSVSASFSGEGSGPFFGLEALSGLHQSRLKFARELINRI